MTNPSTPAGGAVAYRWLRDGKPVGEWLHGAPSARQFQAAKDCSVAAEWTVQYAYTTPPATVPVEAVLALVGKWRAIAGNGNMDDYYADGMRACADELESLTRGEK